ncbi:SDR family oxidoreductase [Rhabdothermincola sediminis]|uniref:SDR family oxidoreductase n=1 Tax=Rhabdothermincola sediminis TaxID=2751370 RepID=UPI001AA090F6|nr:SDR family NAD(P)-dependent oxidoreductase [Rhabdothermincola sediminis]
MSDDESRQVSTGAWGQDTDVAPRVAVVTGASAGIGRAIAVGLGELGWTVAIGARRADRLEETAAAVRAAGGTPWSHPLDVTDDASVDAFFADLEAELGPAHAVVNNAGVGYLGAIAETTTERLRAAVDTNLLGALYCTRAATAAMLRAGIAGDVVFISSDSIQQPYPHMLTYGATKAAIEYLAAGLDVELGGTGIRVTTVRLGPTVSEFNTTWTDEDMIAFMHAWERLGIKQDFNYIPAEAVAHAVITALSAPRGTKVSLLSVRPEVTRSADPRQMWADAADQGRSRARASRDAKGR